MAIWWDLGLNYKLGFEKADTELFFNVRNLLDKDPAIAARQQSGTGWGLLPVEQRAVRRAWPLLPRRLPCADAPEASQKPSEAGSPA